MLTFRRYADNEEDRQEDFSLVQSVISILTGDNESLSLLLISVSEAAQSNFSTGLGSNSKSLSTAPFDWSLDVRCCIVGSCTFDR